MLILGAVLLLIVACNEADGPGSSTNPHFPQLREGGDALIMEALVEGELVLENGCLRAKTQDGSSLLLIWPQRFKLNADGRDTRISDDSGLSLSIGEVVRIGGGEAKLARVQSLVEQPLPNDCPGPYWIVGEIRVP